MILITGASGHIGNVLAALLHQNGHTDLRLMVQGTNTAHIEPYAKEIVRVDICDPKAVSEAVKGCTDVFHLAGYIQVDRSNKKRLYDINAGGARNVALACLEHGVKRLVYASSIHALAPVNGGALDESQVETCGFPSDDYGRSKLQGTKAVLEACRQGLDAVIVYPTGVIGPYDYRSSLAGTMLQKYIKAPGDTHLYFDGGYDFVDVRDVADGLFRAWQMGEKGQGYILAGDRCTLRDMIETIGRSAGREFNTVRMPLFVVRTGAAVAPVFYALAGRPPVLTQDTVDLLVSRDRITSDKAKAKLGYAPRPVAESLSDAVKWYQDQSASV